MGAVLIIIILLPVIFYVQYINGAMTVGSKTAKFFVGEARGDKAYWVSFTACDGELKKVARFRESKTYHFRMNAEISEGRVSVQLLNKDKHQLFSLTPQNPEASVEVEGKERYYIIYKYEAATGNYELTWE